MIKLVLRCVTQGTFLTALIAALSFTPAFAGFGGGESLLACCAWTHRLRRLRRTRGGRASKPPTRSRTTLSSPAFDDPAFSLGYLKEGAQAQAAGETLAEIAKS